MSEWRTMADLTSEPAGGPLIFRPQIRPVAIEGAVAGTVAAFAALFQLTYLPWVAGLYAGGALLFVLRARLSWIRLDDRGLSMRTGLRKRTIPWADVWGIIVHRRLRFTYLHVNFAPGRTLVLPAPRRDRAADDKAFAADLARFRQFANAQPGGVAVQQVSGMPRVLFPLAVVLGLAVGVFLDRPWFWISGAEAARLPDPCAALVAGSATLGVTQAYEREIGGQAGLPARMCVGATADGVAVEVVYLMGEREGLISGEGVADRTYSQKSFLPAGRQYALGTSVGFGDKGIALDGDRFSTVVVRRANAIVFVDLEAELDTPLLNDAIAIAAVGAKAVEAELR